MAMLMKSNRKIEKNFAAILFLTLAIITIFQIYPASADTPHDISIQPWNRASDNHTILNITINHDLQPITSLHYVDSVEVDDGTVHVIPLTDYQSQVSGTFTVQYDMGVVTGQPTVSVRAHCTQHGWSTWTDPSLVPEFSFAQLLLVLTIIAASVLLLQRSLVKRNAASKTTKQ